MDEIHRRARSPSRTRSKSADPGKGRSLESDRIFPTFLFVEEERVFFEIRQSPLKGFACSFTFLLSSNPFFALSRMFSYVIVSLLIFIRTDEDIGFFSNLERTSKRSRILDFFRGRSRATDRDDGNSRDRNQSQVTLIDKTSMKYQLFLHLSIRISFQL